MIATYLDATLQGEELQRVQREMMILDFRKVNVWEIKKLRN